MVKLYKAAVIGLGRIGSSYPSIDIQRTHVGAYLANERINVVACVDSDAKAREEFLNKWGSDIPVCASVKELLAMVQPDIVSVCVPPKAVIDIVEEFQLKRPKLFFIEKPVVTDPGNAKKLLEIINNVPTAVNYHRCWDPAHIYFFENLLKAERIISIRVLYSKGMFNYASHLIALLIRYFGTVKDVTCMPVQSYNCIYSDPSLSFILSFKSKIHAFFQGFDDLPYELLELEVMTTSGLFYLKSGGCRRRQELPKKNSFYTDYTQLVDVPYSLPDSQVEGLQQAVKNIINYLDGIDTELSCDLSLSLDVFDAMWRVKESLLSEKI